MPNRSSTETSRLSWSKRIRRIWRSSRDPKRLPSLARRGYSSSLAYSFYFAHLIYENFSSILAKILVASAGLVVAAIVIQGLTQRVTIVEPISVPKLLADSGYSPEVAAQRFRDSINKYTAAANTHMRRPDLALHTELPNIVVPTVGISLDALMSAIRTLLHSTRSQTVSGEFTIVHDQLWLRLRLNGIEFFTSSQGVDPQKPDDLLRIAVPEALKKTQPYFVAVSLSENDPDAALDLIEWIISNLSEDNDNVAWAYNLKGSILNRRREFPAADEALQKALVLNPALAAAHLNLGNLRASTGKLPEAIEECRKAVKTDPQYALAHNNLAQFLRRSGSLEEAFVHYREAVRLESRDPLFRTNYGIALRAAGLDDDAVRQYREVIRFSPSYPLAHYNLAIVLAARGDFAEAAVENQEAVRLDPKNTRAFNNLGNSLRELGKHDEAVAAFREAVSIDQKFIRARINLANTLDLMGKKAEAVVEFQSILAIEPENDIAKAYLSDVANSAKRSD